MNGDVVDDQGRTVVSMALDYQCPSSMTLSESPAFDPRAIEGSEILAGIPHNAVDGAHNLQGLQLEYHFAREENILRTVINSPVNGDLKASLLSAVDALGGMAGLHASHSLGLTFDLY